MKCHQSQNNPSKEVQFYLDRMKEVATRILQNIVTSPEYDTSETIRFLQEIAKEHRKIAVELEGGVIHAAKKQKKLPAESADWH